MTVPEMDRIRRASAGDAEAFRQLLEMHYMTIYKIAYKWCGKKEDAEDIAQDVCVKLPAKLASFKREAAFTTWLYRLTINAAKDYYRTTAKAQNRELPFAEGFDAPSSEVAADRALAAKQAMAEIHRLPEDLRDALLLVHAEGLNHKEAANVLGCAETTISWRIHKARKELESLRKQYE